MYGAYAEYTVSRIQDAVLKTQHHSLSQTHLFTIYAPCYSVDEVSMIMAAVHICFIYPPL